MGTVLIADDEKNIREGLTCIMDWDAYGFQVCGEAANGEEALHMIMEMQPSIVLLDLHMPKIHGIEVIRMAREQGYEGRFIILSGYSDFSYAQSAIRYGVTNYLTKPIDEDELQKTVGQIREDLEKETAKRGSLRRIQTKAKDAVLEELLAGVEDKETGEISEEDLTAICLKADSYQVVVYETYYTDRKQSPYAIGEVIAAFVNSDAYEYCEMEQRQVLLLKGKGAIRQFQRFLDHYEKRPLQADSPLDTMFLAYGQIVSRAEKIKDSYLDARRLCDRRFYCAEGAHTFGYLELSDIQETDEHITKERLHIFSSRLIGYLQAGSVDKVHETLKDLELYLHHVTDSIQDVRLFITDLYLQIKEQVSRTYPECEELFESNSLIIEFIGNRFYLYEIMQFIETKAREIVLKIRGRAGAESTMQDVLSYIDHNFQGNLTLEEVAPLFGYNSVYFGKVFSKSTGSSFNSYLNERRIIQARKLLEDDDLKIYEIAARVGYSDVDYFSKKFRSQEGISPADYRRQLRADIQQENIEE
ncbi:MAG: response regulator [Butyrivibrio sp.]|nr:response regulator [Butyrivibrio sp.]